MPRGTVAPEALERSRAARALLDAHLFAEGVRLAKQALSLALDGLTGDAKEVADAFVRTPAPRLDREVTRADVESAWRALALLEDEVLAPMQATRRRLLLGALVVLLLAALWFRFGPGPAVVAVASESYSGIPVQGPSAVLDDDDQTNWLLPDRATGWIELRLRSPRRVDGVEIINGHNPPYEDRAAHEVEVALLGADGAILSTETQELALSSAPAPTVFDVRADAVSRVRVFVRSFHRRGGALDRVRVLP